MAELVGLVAASGQFVEESIKIIKLSKKFRDKFKDAPTELEGWQEEVTSLSKVVDKIQKTPALQIDDLEPIINQCRSASNKLLKIFNDIDFEVTDSFTRKSWRTTVALSKEGDIRDLFALIERLKSTLTMQLGIVQIAHNEEGIAQMTSAMEGLKGSFQSGTDEEQCLQALFLTDPVSDRERLITTKGHRTSGTCEWVMKTQEYQEWNAVRTGLLWIAGPPGKGKTFISIFLSQHLETSKPDATIIWFFCDNKSDHRNNVIGILRGLMIQLIMKHNHLTPLLLSAWKIQKATLFSPGSFETLWSIFLSMLNALHDQELCCVLDGLDECVESSLSVLLFKLKTLFQHPSRSNTQFTGKFIIASREDPQMIFETLSTFPRITLDDLKDDINLYIADRVAHLAEVKNIRNTPLQHEIEAALTKGAEGTFLWVSFMSQDLENSTVNEIENALLHLPQGLYPLYQRIIDRIKPETRQAVSDMLTWILFAVRPLTIAELSDAIQVKGTKALEPEEVCLGHLKACGHLLQLYYIGTDEKDIILGKVRTRTSLLHVTFMHQSAKDFLLTMAVDCPILRPAINPRKGHTTIADRLISLICENLDNDQVEMPEARHRTPALSYAIDQWEYHIAELQDGCKDVLRKHVAFFGDKSKPRDNLSWQSDWLPFDESIARPRNVPFLQTAYENGLCHLIEAWLLPRNPLLRFRRKQTINQKWGRFGETPLHKAVRHHQKEVVEVLLRFGADASIECCFSKTSLHIAVEEDGYRPFVNEDTQDVNIYHLLSRSKTGIAMLKKQAKHSIRSPEKRLQKSILHSAVDHGSGSICQDLIETFHYNVDSISSAGYKPLHLALRNRNIHISNMLVTRYGASLHPQIDFLRAMMASEYPKETLEACILMFAENWGCDINTTDESGNTIFHDPTFGYDELQAIQACRLTIDWNERNDRGQNFLHSNTTWSRDARLLYDFLHHSQWDINAIDNDGRTPLHAVILEIQNLCQDEDSEDSEDQEYSFFSTKREKYPSLETKLGQMYLIDIQALLDFGADRTLPDANGATASDMVMYLLTEVTIDSPSVTRVRDWAEHSLEMLESYETVAINPLEVALQLESQSWSSGMYQWQRTIWVFDGSVLTSDYDDDDESTIIYSLKH